MCGKGDREVSGGERGCDLGAHAVAALDFLGSGRAAPPAAAADWAALAVGGGGGGSSSLSLSSLSLCLPPLPCFAIFFFLDLRLFPEPAAASSGSTCAMFGRRYGKRALLLQDKWKLCLICLGVSNPAQLNEICKLLRLGQADSCIKRPCGLQTEQKDHKELVLTSHRTSHHSFNQAYDALIALNTFLITAMVR